MNKEKLGILVTALAIAGCATDLSDKWRVDDIHKKNETNDDKPKLIDLDEEIKRVSNESDTAKKTLLRTALQDKIIRTSDNECEKHKAAIIARGSLINFSSGWGATALSSVASISTGGSAKMYSAASTVVNAGRSGYNADIYFGFLTAAIVREIDADRAKKLNSIRSNQAMDEAKYNVERSIKEALDYHYSCSFYTGLSHLVEEKKAQTIPPYSVLKERLEELSAKSTAIQAAINSATDEKIKKILHEELSSLHQAKQGILDLIKIQSQREN